MATTSKSDKQIRVNTQKKNTKTSQKNKLAVSKHNTQRKAQKSLN